MNNKHIGFWKKLWRDMTAPWRYIAKEDNKHHDLYNITEGVSDHLTDEIYKILLKKEDNPDPKAVGSQGRENTFQQAAGNQEQSSSIDLDKYLDECIEDALSGDLKKEIAEIVTKQISSRLSEELLEQYHPTRRFFQVFDFIITKSRWIMAFVYAALIFVLICILLHTGIDVTRLLIVTCNEVLSGINILLENGFSEVEIGDMDSLTQIIRPTVKVLDLVLVGSLVVMVLIGGYENTVSRIGMRHSMPTWLGKLNISELKVKVAASIIIISSIHLLEEFLQLKFPVEGNDAAVQDLKYYLPLLFTALIHLVFIASALAITSIAKKSHN